VFGLAETHDVLVATTGAAGRLVERAARRREPLRLTAHATFDGYWAGPVEATLSATVSLPRLH
jgi:hypothetical protein